MSNGLAQELARIVVEKRAEMARNVAEDRKRLAAELAERWVPLRKVVFEQAAQGKTVVEGNPKLGDYKHLEPVEAEVLSALPQELVQMHKDGCLRVWCPCHQWKNLTLSFDITKLVEAIEKVENPGASNGDAAAATERTHTEVIHVEEGIGPGDCVRMHFRNDQHDHYSCTAMIPQGMDPIQRVVKVNVPLPHWVKTAGLHCFKTCKAIDLQEPLGWNTSPSNPIDLDPPANKKIKTEADGVPPMPEGAFVIEETVPAPAESGSSPEGGDREMDCWKRWTDEDLEKLRTVVPQHETACGYAWSRIIPSFPNRTLSSVQQRWERLKRDDQKSQKDAQPPAEAAPAAAAPAEAAPVSKGILMSELVELIQQNPHIKKDIQAVVDRADYTEVQKMDAIRRLVRETTTGTTGTTGTEK